MWLPEELDVCDHPLCFFKGVNELKRSFMEENKLYTCSLLLPTNEAYSGGKNLPLRNVSKVHAGDISYRRRVKGRLSCAPADTLG